MHWTSAAARPVCRLRLATCRRSRDAAKGAKVAKAAKAAKAAKVAKAAKAAKAAASAFISWNQLELVRISANFHELL